MTSPKPTAGALRAARATRMEWDNAKRAQIIAETSGMRELVEAAQAVVELRFSGDCPWCTSQVDDGEGEHDADCNWLRLRAARAKVTQP